MIKYGNTDVQRKKAENPWSTINLFSKTTDICMHRKSRTAEQKRDLSR